MTQGMGTTTETMEAASQHVYNVNQDIQAKLSQLRSEVSSLQGVWVGAAKNAFEQLMIRWDDDANKLNQALSTIGDTIKTNSVNYSVSQQEHVQSLQGAGGGSAEGVTTTNLS